MKARVRAARIGNTSSATWAPPDPVSWRAVVTLDLVHDEDADPVTTQFSIAICSSQWLDETVHTDGYVAGGRRLVVQDWNPDALAHWWRTTIEATEAPTWNELLARLTRQMTPAGPPVQREFVGSFAEELQIVHSPDVLNIETWQPDDPDDFCLFTQYSVRPANDIGEEWFDLTVCTPHWIARRLADTGVPFDARYHLIVSRWDIDEVERRVRDAIRTTPDHMSLHARGDLGRWVEEGYVESEHQPLLPGPLKDFFTSLPSSRFRCPVCGYPDLVEPPRIGTGSGSYAYCPSCDFQFGVSDDDKGFTYETWRERWIARGMPWAAGDDLPRPAGWDPAAQLRNLDE